jgi:hypothetical protein
MKTVIFVYAAPPILSGGFRPSPSVFSLRSREKEYLDALNFHLNDRRMGWQAQLDKTCSEIDEIRQQAQAIICAPGLKYQFRTNGFDTNRIIYLSVMEYWYHDTGRVMKFLAGLDKQDVILA